MAGGDLRRRRRARRRRAARARRGPARHEARAGLVDEHRALAAHGLADQRHGIEPDIERGRMELHELQIAQRRAGPGRQRQPLADGAQRVGGVRHRDRPARRWRARRDGSAAGSALGSAPPPARRRSRGRRPAGGGASSPSITVIEGVAAHRRDQRAHDRAPRCRRPRHGRCGGGRARPPGRARSGRAASRSKRDAVALQLGDGGRRRRGDAARRRRDRRARRRRPGCRRHAGPGRRPRPRRRRCRPAPRPRRRPAASGALAQQDHGPRRQPQRRHSPARPPPMITGPPAQFRADRLPSASP